MKKSITIVSALLLLFSVSLIPGLSFGINTSITTNNNPVIIESEVPISNVTGGISTPINDNEYLIHGSGTNNITSGGGSKEVSFEIAHSKDFYILLILDQSVFANNSKTSFSISINSTTIPLSKDMGSTNQGITKIYLYYESSTSETIVGHNTIPTTDNLWIDSKTDCSIIAKNTGNNSSTMEVHIIFKKDATSTNSTLNLSDSDE